MTASFRVVDSAVTPGQNHRLDVPPPGLSVFMDTEAVQTLARNLLVCTRKALSSTRSAWAWFSRAERYERSGVPCRVNTPRSKTRVTGAESAERSPED